MTIKLPENAAFILDRLTQHGHEAYIVGGCVRDAVLGNVPKDWDITTSAKPEEIKALFRSTYDTGIEHGTVSVRLNLEIYEVTTFRVDGEYSDHRRPDSVAFTTSLEEDLKRRDFTMNAMAYHPSVGIVDLFGGQEDLKKGLIRCVGNANERFEEDALRMLRAFRFAARYGFAIEEKSAAAIVEKAPLLKNVSAERIREEMNQILASAHPEMIREIIRSGLMTYIVPEFLPCTQCEQHTKYHLYPVDEHTYRVMTGIDSREECALLLRWAAFLHDIAKPGCRTTDADGTDHFFGHPEKSAEMADRILKNLKFDNDSRRMIVLLIAKHDHEHPKNEREMRYLLNTLPDGIYPLILRLMQSDAKAKNPAYGERSLQEIAQSETLYHQVLSKNQCIKLSDLAISGKDLIAMGYKSGKTIGTTLNILLKQALDQPEINRKEVLIPIAEQLKETLNQEQS